MNNKQRGGPRIGSGRPKLPKREKRVKVAITLSPAHYIATAGDRSRIIDQALTEYFAHTTNVLQTSTNPDEPESKTGHTSP
jgi:hypothetical protein